MGLSLDFVMMMMMTTTTMMSLDIHFI